MGIMKAKIPEQLHYLWEVVNRVGLPKDLTTETTKITEKTSKKLPWHRLPGQVCGLRALRGERSLSPFF
jgi:hypothetical protein